MKLKIYVIISLLTLSQVMHCLIKDNDAHIQPVTIAILVKDKAHCLPLYLFCIENQTWPKSKTCLYIRTNDNNDTSAELLKSWISKVKDQYLDIFFDDSNVGEHIRGCVQHEWNCDRFKTLGKIRQDSLDWAYRHNSHYFVADCDNFIYPHTIESLVQSGLPLVAPLLHSNSAYSNFHDGIDHNGYNVPGRYCLAFINREIRGYIQVPVVHCTYLIRNDIIPEMSYDDESYRYEYVIFSDNARKRNIPQYLDTTDAYGYISFAVTSADLETEPWFSHFHTHILEKILPCSRVA